METMTTSKGAEVTLYAAEDRAICQLCGAWAVVPLTPKQLAQQPDETTHVCHPGLGGCNHGFTDRA